MMATAKTEPSAWLRGAVAEALANNFLRALRAGPQPAAQRLVARLRPTYGDRQCDRCGVNVPPCDDFYSFLALQEGVAFVVGLCAQHARAEGAIQ